MPLANRRRLGMGPAPAPAPPEPLSPAEIIVLAMLARRVPAGEDRDRVTDILGCTGRPISA